MPDDQNDQPDEPITLDVQSTRQDMSAPSAVDEEE